MIFGTTRWLSGHSFAQALAIILVAALGPNASAQTTLLFEDFDGPTLNPVFQASLPDAARGSGGNKATYLGGSSHSFHLLGDATVLRTKNTLDSRQRRGWSTSAVFKATEFRLESRFNVLSQGPSISYDSFIESWLLDPNDSSRFLFAGPDNGDDATRREFRIGSTINAQYMLQDFNFLDGAWYRLVITGSTSENIRASLFADDGATELVGQTFGFNVSAFPDGFRLGLSQATGVPGRPVTVDGAIDYVRLTGTAVPEPPTAILSGGALGGLMLLVRRFHRTNQTLN